MLKDLIIVGGSAMIMQEIADRVRQAKIDREKTLRRKKTGILALGITLGSTVGALAGVLFAPKAGKEMREDLGRQGCAAWGKMKENAFHTGHRLVSAVEEKSSRLLTAAEKPADAANGASKDPVKEDEGAEKIV